MSCDFLKVQPDRPTSFHQCNIPNTVADLEGGGGHWGHDHALNLF